MPIKPTIVWYFSDQADAYLLASALHLARATQKPLALPLPAPSISATLYCAFAAEAYVNLALLRIVGEVEYRQLSKIPVRSKYFLITRLGSRREWFTSGEQVLEDLDELFAQRNRLVHAQPEGTILHPASTPGTPERHTDLSNVARWLAATADATLRLARADAELSEFERVAGPIADAELMLRQFQPKRDGPKLDKLVRNLMRRLLKEDNEDSMEDDELDALIDRQDPDWDVRGLEPND